MRERGKRILRTGICTIALFAVWTVLIQVVDVQCAGQTGMEVGFATVNEWFHRVTGVHMLTYAITDWMGLVPIFVCLIFGVIGLVQMVQRKGLRKVDLDIILLGFYYVLVICGYLVFEMIPINYRPIFIEGRLEGSYPSSTTLLVLSVMPTLAFQAHWRLRNVKAKKTVSTFTAIFSLLVVFGRLISGVHWFTDIVGAILLSTGLFCMYKAVVILLCEEK